MTMPKLANYITKDKIEECQRLIDTSREGFFDDIAPILENLRGIMDAGQLTEKQIDAMGTAAADIQSHASLFGYQLIAALAGQLTALLASKRFDNERKTLLVRKYVEALAMACERRINDSGGTVGELILKDLAAATAK